MILDVEEIQENEPTGVPGSTFTGWMYSHYFEFVKEKEKNILVKCKLCRPVPGRKAKELSTSKISTSNLKKHLDTVHPDTKLNKKRDEEDTSTPKPKQQKLDFSARVERLDVREVRRLVAEYVVEDMKPLSTVESPAFVKLVSRIPVKQTLGKQVRCRCQFLLCLNNILYIMQKNRGKCNTQSHCHSL